jgi:hypothetical protein
VREAFAVNIAQDDAKAGGGGHLSNAVTHCARTKHGDGFKSA